MESKLFNANCTHNGGYYGCQGCLKNLGDGLMVTRDFVVHLFDFSIIISILMVIVAV